MPARNYVNMMEQDYVSIQKGSGHVYACANMLYQTRGSVKYLKCFHENCDGVSFILGVCAIYYYLS